MSHLQVVLVIRTRKWRFYWPKASIIQSVLHDAVALKIFVFQTFTLFKRRRGLLFLLLHLLTRTLYQRKELVLDYYVPINLNNDRLFTVPDFVIAHWYVHFITRSHHKYITGDGLVEWEKRKWHQLLVMGRQNEKKKKLHQYAEEKRRVCSFNLKEERKRMPDRERKRVPDHGSGSLPHGPPAHPWNMEDLSMWGWMKRAKRRVKIQSYSIPCQTR